MAIVRLRQAQATLTVAPPAPPPAGPAEAAAAPATATTTAQGGYVALAVFLVVGAWLVSWWLSSRFWDTGGMGSSQVVQGVSIFALLYVASQAVERFLEPFSTLLLPTAQKEQERDQALARYQQAKTGAAGEAAALKQAELDRIRANRRLLFWGLATVVGLFASAALKLYFLRALGVPDSPRWAEILVTGLVIGAGTKPLHDLISRIEKSKENAADPPEVGGSS